MDRIIDNELGKLPAIPRTQKLACIAVLLVLAWPVSVWMHTSWYALHLHADSTYPESAVVHNAMLAVQDGHLYRSWHEEPFTPAPYGPLYYALLASIAKIGSLDHIQLLIAGRILTFAAFLGTLLLIYRLSHRLDLSPLHAYIAVAFFAALQEVVPWNATVRPDFIALFFSLVGFMICTKDSASNRDLMLGGVCFAVSLMFKQSFLVAPAVVFMMLLTQRRTKSLFAFAVPVFGIIGFCLIAPWLHGDAVFSNLLTTGQGVIDLQNSFSSLFDSLVYPGIHLPIIVCTFVGVIGWKKQRNLKILSDYLLLVWFLGVLIWIRILGSNINVFLEAWVVSAVFAGIGLRYMVEKNRVLAPVLIVCAILVSSLHPVHGLQQLYIQKMNEMPGLSGIEDLVSHYRILTDDSYLEALSASPIMLEPCGNNQMEQSGVWDPKPVIDLVHGKRFDMVILSVEGRFIRRYRYMPFFSVSILKALNTDYVLKCHIPKSPGVSSLAVWLPRYMHEDPVLMDALYSRGCK